MTARDAVLPPSLKPPEALKLSPRFQLMSISRRRITSPQTRLINRGLRSISSWNPLWSILTSDHTGSYCLFS